ncbi:transcriptional regulator [Desulfosporosinus orientis DSM 765]|uniref:Transcriptional regulator n=1 Tax=Desulfosporosinus orientis (strain ATCC 19365 / DSM 765 / NCIMB 8382 / VKM B-1628 / Singapore I) TaxID=768706 RepID=G7WAZ7_DESOD|nr:MarR family winged helix-turn-helix transcriptional regulator [Desulfosporosinus orientis]AET67498.1 transcriptional regulator [Desulfosporosinus orientis DSM 765]
MSETPCNCMKLRRASLAITKLYDQYLQPAGLTVSQYSIMQSIRRSAPVSVSELAAKTQLDRTTMVRNLHPLEKQGIVLDVSKPGTRNRQLTLSKYGEDKLKSAELLWLQAQENVKTALGESDLATLAQLLLKVESLHVSESE